MEVERFRTVRLQKFGVLLKGVAVVLLAMSFTNSALADIVYQLAPGSSITPWFQGQPTGPTEPLTGTFTWRLTQSNAMFVGFNATALRFQSTSFILELNTTVNDVGTSVFLATPTSYFSEIVDVVGANYSPLEFYDLAVGSYDGPYNSPTRLVYSDMFLAPPSGGSFVAAISFTAVQVPEPTIQTLLLMGFGLFAGCKTRQWFTTVPTRKIRS